MENVNIRQAIQKKILKIKVFIIKKKNIFSSIEHLFQSLFSNPWELKQLREFLIRGRYSSPKCHVIKITLMDSTKQLICWHMLFLPKTNSFQAVSQFRHCLPKTARKKICLQEKYYAVQLACLF